MLAGLAATADAPEPPLRVAVQAFIPGQFGPLEQWIEQSVGRGYVALGRQYEPSLPPWFTLTRLGLVSDARVVEYPNGRDYELQAFGWWHRRELANLVASTPSGQWPRPTRTSRFKKIANLDGTVPLDRDFAGIYEEIIGSQHRGRISRFTSYPRRYWRPFELDHLDPNP